MLKNWKTVTINKLPQNGLCLVSPLNGMALETYFTVTCLNWTDPDGFISAYEVFCKLPFKIIEIILIISN